MSKLTYQAGDKVLVIIDPRNTSLDTTPVHLGDVLTIQSKLKDLFDTYSFEETDKELAGRCVIPYFYSSDTESGGFCNGWPNEETYEAATVFFNDAELLEHAKKHLISCVVEDINATRAANAILVRGINGSIKNICCLSILKHFTVEELRLQHISSARYQLINRTLENVFTLLHPSLKAKAQAIADTRNKKQNSVNSTTELKTTTQQSEDKIIMKIETKHFVNGQDIVSMSLDEKLQLIKDTENKIAELRAIEVRSKMVENEIKKLQIFLLRAVALFDNQ